MILFDSHAHLDDEQFDGRRDQIVSDARQAGVQYILTVGTTAESSQQCLQLASRYDSVWCAVGIQPNYCGEAADGDWDQVVSLAQSPKVVALGETGLDRYWDYAPLDLQQEYFDRHLRLSQKLNLPVVIHMRDCAEDIVSMLQQASRRQAVRGVMHSFTGDAETAARCIKLGLHISFAGMVTYKKATELRQVAATIPADRILVETDSPYLSPHPKRGQRPNQPALLIHTAQCLAEVRNVDPVQLAAQTTNNARQLFGV
jgi:TatD DNase family protein